MRLTMMQRRKVARALYEIATEHGGRAVCTQEGEVRCEWDSVQCTINVRKEYILCSWYGAQRDLRQDVLGHVNPYHFRKATLSTDFDAELFESMFRTACKAIVSGDAFKEAT